MCFFRICSEAENSEFAIEPTASNKGLCSIWTIVSYSSQFRKQQINLDDAIIIFSRIAKFT